MARKTKGLKKKNLNFDEPKKSKKHNPNALAPIYEKITNKDGDSKELDGKISKFNSVLKSNTSKEIYKVLNKIIIKDE